MKKSSQEHSLVRSSAAEYLTYIAAAGEDKDSIEMRYEEENIWLTQKMMAVLYGVSVAAINQHIKKIFADRELDAEAVVKKYLITQLSHLKNSFESLLLLRSSYFQYRP